MIAPCVPRPASSPPPAWWRAFVCRPSGRPASTKHTSATAARLRPSATVAAWQPGPAAPVPYRHPSLRSDVDLLSRCLRYRLPPAYHSPGSPWLHLATSGVRRYCSASPASARLRPASPTPEDTPQGFCRLSGSQPLLAIARDSLCLPWAVLHRLKTGAPHPNKFLPIPPPIRQ